MKLVIQRVRNASVTVAGKRVGEIGPGALVLVGVARGDTDLDAAYLARKTSQLRFFDDAEGRLNLAIQAVPGGAFLAVSQFTLYADCSGGNRPSYTEAAEPKEAERLYGAYVSQLRLQGHRVETGVFGGEMLVALENDGPVTLILESRGRTQR